MEFKEIKEENARLLEQDRKENRRILRAYPTLVTLTTDIRCNLKCIMCHLRGIRDDELLKIHPLEEEYLIKFASQVFPTAQILRLNTAGEPLLSRTLELELELALKYGLKLQLFTNGTLLSHKKGIWERIVKNSCFVLYSFDSPVKETYESIRPGADYFLVLQNMHLFQRYRNNLSNAERPMFIIHMVVMRRNLSEVNQMISFAKHIGADALYLCRIIIFTEETEGESLDNCKEEFNRTMLEAQKLANSLGLYVRIPPLYAEQTEPPDGKILRRCNFIWEEVLLDYNANIWPCCSPSRPVVGSIKDNDFKEIWNGEVYQLMRRTFTEGYPYKLCQDCAEHGYLTTITP